MAGLLAIVFIVLLIGVFRPFKFAPQVKRMHYGAAAFVTFILIGVTAPAEQSATSQAPDSQKVSEPIASASAQDAAKPQGEPAGKWTYSEQKDEMRGAVTRFAELDAENTIQLDFPYGEQRGQILVRKSPQFGLDVLVGVPSGQIMCHSFSNSRINVKFDDGPIERFSCTDASDGTNNMIFVRNASSFLAKLKKSKRVVVEAEFFQNGMQQMVFETANLKWE